MTFRSITLALALLTTALLTGCGSYTDLRADDGSTPVGSLRAVHRFGGGPGGGGLELDLQGVRGKATQQLASFDQANLGNQTIRGPVQLQHTAEAQHAQLAYNHRLFVNAPVEFEWFAGVALHRIQWRTSSSNPADPRLAFTNTWYGPAGGVAARFKLGPIVALEMRYSGAAEFDSLDGSRASAEVALAISPVQQVQLRLGFADSRSSYQPDGSASDLRLRARGPFAGLALAF
jgi:hypothetical protein